MNALIAAWSLRSFRHGSAVRAGAVSADFLLMFLTLTLYGVLKGLGQRFFAPFYAAGGPFFLYLAYRLGTAKPPQKSSADEGHPVRGYLLGLSLGLVNPYQVAHGGAQLYCQLRRGVAAGLFLAILTWIIAFPAAVRSGWRLNSRLTWLTIKFFSAAVLVVFGALYI